MQEIQDLSAILDNSLSKTINEDENLISGKQEKKLTLYKYRFVILGVYLLLCIAYSVSSVLGPVSSLIILIYNQPVTTVNLVS